MFFAIVAALATILCLVLVYAFLTYQPLPDELDDWLAYRTVSIIAVFIDFCAMIPSTLFGWHFDLQRYLANKGMKPVHQNHPELEVKDLKFEGVPVRVYKLKSLKDPAPAVIFLHGGGWSLLSVDTMDATTVPLALNTGMVVISIEYRLAPENPYPAAFVDCLQATKHVLTNGQMYGIDVNRVAICGESAGGNLATTVALKLSEEKSASMPSLKLQVLMCAVTQVINFRTSSYLLYKNYPLLSQRMMATYMASYLLQDLRGKVVKAITENRHISPNVRQSAYKDYFKKENLPKDVRQNPDEELEGTAEGNVDEDIAKKMDTLAVDPYVSPLLAPNLSQLPPAYVVVSEFDVLRDDGLLYVHRLRQAGVDVELSFIKNQPHPFMGIQSSPLFAYSETVPEWDKIYKFLQKNL